MNEWGQLLRLRREERKVVSRTIADLLEIRYELKGFNLVMSEFRERFLISVEDELVAKQFVDELIPQAEDLLKRYNESVTLVASIDPIMGFRLRSKDQFKPILQKLRSLLGVGDDISAKSSFLQFESRLSDKFVEILEVLIIELAMIHGWRTWLRIRRQFSKPKDASKQMVDLLAFLLPENKQTANTAIILGETAEKVEEKKPSSNNGYS